MDLSRFSSEYYFSPLKQQKTIGEYFKRHNISFKNGFYKIITDNITINTLTQEVISNKTNKKIWSLAKPQDYGYLLNYMDHLAFIANNEKINLEE